MFNPNLPKLPNPFAYLEQMARRFKSQTTMPTFGQTNQTSQGFQPHIPALRPYGPFAQSQAVPSFPTQPNSTTTNMGGMSASWAQPTGSISQMPGLGTAGFEPYKLDLSAARIANTKRQVPENLLASWDTLGPEWQKQFSTWQQSYVNEFLTKYAAGDFAGANDVARSWYDEVDKREKSRAAQAQEQDYLDAQSQYRMSGYIG